MRRQPSHRLRRRRYVAGRGRHDTLDGGSGADSLVGGTENDTYIIDNAKDVIQEFGAAASRSGEDLDRPGQVPGWVT
jgi:Ca2+-binding RTX toxin-like protein